jgi:uncharacterized protein
MKYFFTILFFVIAQWATAQIYEAHIDSFRKNYIAELIAEPRQPLKAQDTIALRFYKTNKNYLVNATVKRIYDSIGFEMRTHSGKIKKYYKYAALQFKIKSKPQILYLYQSKTIQAIDGYEDYLFLPFNDATNYDYTFGGGRYLDLKEKEIRNNIIKLDFNKCYNPYCAYTEGFNCPIPPSENKLKIKIKAGEMRPDLNTN